jgi:hypothetical protein
MMPACEDNFSHTFDRAIGKGVSDGGALDSRLKIGKGGGCNAAVTGDGI